MFVYFIKWTARLKTWSVKTKGDNQSGANDLHSSVYVESMLNRHEVVAEG